MPHRVIPSASPQAYAASPGPFVAPISGDINQRLTQIAAAINTKVDREGTPTFAWIKLIAPGGSVYALSVDDNGNLHTTQVLRS